MIVVLQFKGYHVLLEIFLYQTDYTAFRKVCNQWRNYYDIQDSWTSMYGIIDYYGQDHYRMSEFAGPGGWNDPDEV